MPPVRRVRKAVTVTKSPYETPICVILVGGEEAKFKLHTGLLERTEFFEKHGLPKFNELPKETAPAIPTQEGTQDKAAEFLFPSREQTEETEPEVPRVIDLVEKEHVDYNLQDKFYYSRDSFNVFYRHLNDAPPATPTDSESCEALFKAYALAELYNVKQLQNEIIGALQTFYLQATIPITDLIYVVNRFTTDCTLYQYLVAQVAYEMASDWPKFRKENSEVMKIFRSGESAAGVIDNLFESAMGYAKPLESADPAKHRRSWRL